MFEAMVVSDDDIERRSFLYEMLAELSYRVTTVFPKELAELLKRERPQWIILAVEGQAPSLAAITRELRGFDWGFRLIVLASPSQREELTSDLTDDPRLTVLSAEADRPTLIRSILSLLKARTVEPVGVQHDVQGPILVIEDDPHAARFLTTYLQRRGYQVTSVPDGEQALVQMRVLAPRIVLLDLLLPGMDGLLTLKRLKALDPGVTVIVTSGVDDAELQHEALRLDASAYLVKPFDLARLEAAILASTLRR